MGTKLANKLFCGSFLRKKAAKLSLRLGAKHFIPETRNSARRRVRPRKCPNIRRKSHFFVFCRPKTRFFYIDHHWEKAFFLFWQLFPVVARTWLEARSACSIFAQKFSNFCPKIRSLIWNQNFCQWSVCCPRRCSCFATIFDPSDIGVCDACFF